MARPQKKNEQKWTYGDYCQWSDDERWELIDGVEYNMTPAPNRLHAHIVMEFGRQLANFFSDKTCKVYLAPFDVRLPEANEADDEVTTVIQPDVVIVCDPAKLDDKGCRGAPDLVIEVLSPSTASKDCIQKRALYERHKVKEYWLVHPTDKLLTVYRLQKNGHFGFPEMYDRTMPFAVSMFPGLEVNLPLIFPSDTHLVKESPAGKRSPTRKPAKSA